MNLFGPEGDCTPEEAAAAVKAVRAATPSDVAAIIRLHQQQEDGHPDTFLDCCEALTLHIVRKALARDSARLSLQAAALAPWREDG